MAFSVSPILPRQPPEPTEDKKKKIYLYFLIKTEPAKFVSRLANFCDTNYHSTPGKNFDGTAWYFIPGFGKEKLLRE